MDNIDATAGRKDAMIIIKDTWIEGERGGGLGGGRGGGGRVGGGGCYGVGGGGEVEEHECIYRDGSVYSMITATCFGPSLPHMLDHLK